MYRVIRLMDFKYQGSKTKLHTYIHTYIYLVTTKFENALNFSVISVTYKANN